MIRQGDIVRCTSSREKVPGVRNTRRAQVLVLNDACGYVRIRLLYGKRNYPMGVYFVPLAELKEVRK